MSTTIQNKQSGLELRNSNMLLRGVLSTRFDSHKAIALLLNFQDEIEALLGAHQLDFDGSGIQFETAQDPDLRIHENPFFEYAQQQIPEQVNDFAETLLQETGCTNPVFMHKIYNLFASLVHVENTINLWSKTPDAALGDISGHSIESLSEHAPSILFLLLCSGQDNYGLLMQIHSLSTDLSRRGGSNQALNHLITDFTALLNQMALSYALMNDHPVAQELLSTERNIYKDVYLNDNQKIGTVQLPSYALNGNECTPRDEDGGYCLNALVTVPEAQIQHFAKALSYTLSRECSCEHDCCGCQQISNSAEVVSSNTIHLKLRHSYNY